MLIIKEVLFQIFICLLPFILFNVYYRDKTINYSKNFIIITGIISLFLSMTFPLSIIPGFIIDTHYVIIFFGLIFGGLQTGIILLVEFLLYRFYLGGAGKWLALMNIVITFPISILFYKMYVTSGYYRRITIVFVYGIVCSVSPLAIKHIYNAGSIAAPGHHGFILIVIPALQCLEICLLIYLFDKAVSDKNFFINHVEDEKVRTIGHVAASLVHEVRNPLTTMKGFLTLIKQNAFDKNKLERYIEICMDEVNRTEMILSEYLAISKPLIEHKKELADFSKLLENTKDVMTPYANMNNVLLVVDKQPNTIKIFTNPEEIKQVLVNILKNSIEACFHKQDGKVRIRLHEENMKIVLEIEDNGIGMDEQQLRRLGTIYYSTKTSGTGLGLTFSYQAIRALGGSISVRSERGIGTVFRITLHKDKRI